MPRRISKRFSGMEQERAPAGNREHDWRNPPDVPMQLMRAKVLKRKGRDARVRLTDDSEESINAANRGVSTAFRAGVDPIPPVGAWLDVMVHGLCPWKGNRDGKLRVDIHHWQKDSGYCNYESGYRSQYDAGNGLFAVPPWDIDKENK